MYEWCQEIRKCCWEVINYGIIFTFGFCSGKNAVNDRCTLVHFRHLNFQKVLQIHCNFGDVDLRAIMSPFVTLYGCKTLKVGSSFGLIMVLKIGLSRKTRGYQGCLDLATQFYEDGFFSRETASSGEDRGIPSTYAISVSMEHDKWQINAYV